MSYLSLKQLVITRLLELFTQLNIVLPVKYPNQTLDVSNLQEYITVDFLYGQETPISASGYLAESVNILQLKWILKQGVGENTQLNLLEGIKDGFNKSFLFNEKNSIGAISSSINVFPFIHEYQLVLNVSFRKINQG